MDCHVSPRVTYWTGVWDPRREALSKEVEAIRAAHRPEARVVSFSGGQRSVLGMRHGVVQLSGKRVAGLRLLASFLERRTDVNHVFGAASEWHFLRVLGRRPLLFTVALPGVPPVPALLDKVAIFAAESHTLAAAVIAAGVPPERVRIVYPGIDLDRYAPSVLPSTRPFRVLFASTPADPREIEARGVGLIIGAARAMPDVEFVLLWRPWGDRRAAEMALQALDPPQNVAVEWRPIENMADQYQRAHATVCCFAEGFGKSCPNSIVEGLACGRPTLVADTVGIAPLIEDHSAGVMVPRTVEGLVRGVERLRSRIADASIAARTLAERVFGMPQFLRTYEDFYAALYSKRACGRAAHRAYGGRTAVGRPGAAFRKQPELG